MKLVLQNGSTLERPAGCALMGFNIERVSFDAKDLHSLLDMEDAQLRFWFESLSRRCAAMGVELCKEQV